MNVPNAISVFRMLLIPINLWALLDWPVEVFIGIFVCTGLTDVLDGFLARRWQQTTRKGLILDALADKALMLSLLIALFFLNRLEIWQIVLLFSREWFVWIGFALIRIRTGGLIGKTSRLPTSQLGKLTTFLLVVMIIALALDFQGTVFISVAIIFSLLAGLDYYWRGYRFLKEEKII